MEFLLQLLFKFYLWRGQVSNTSSNYYNVLLDISAFSNQKVEDLQNFLVSKGVDKESILQFIPGRNRYNNYDYESYTTGMVVPFEENEFDLELIAECIRQYYEMALVEIDQNATEGIKPDAHLVVNTSFLCEKVFKKDGGPEAFGLFMRGCSSHQRNESLSGIMYPVQKLLYYRKENMLQVNRGDDHIRSVQPLIHETGDKYVGRIDDLFVDPRKGIDELIWKVDGYIRKDGKYIPRLTIESKYRHYRNTTFDYDQMDKVLWNGRRSRGIIIPENSEPEVINKSVRTENGIFCTEPSLASFLSKRVENNVRQRVIRFPAQKRLTEDDRRELEEKRKNFRLKTFNDKTQRFINGFFLYKESDKPGKKKTSKKHNQGVDYLNESVIPDESVETTVATKEIVENNQPAEEKVSSNTVSENWEEASVSDAESDEPTETVSSEDTTPAWEPVDDSPDESDNDSESESDDSSSSDSDSADSVDDESISASYPEEDDEDESSFEPHDEGEDPHGAEAMQEEFDQDDA